MQSNIVTLLIYAIPALLIAISLHETMHSVVGYWLGDDTAKVMGRISFNPLAHIDPLLPTPRLVPVSRTQGGGTTNHTA